MGSIVDGQPVNAAVTNQAKVDRLTDDQIYGKIDLLNADSPFIYDMQSAINGSFGNAKTFLYTATHQKVSFDGVYLDSPEDMIISIKDTGFTNTILAGNFPMNIPDGYSVYVTLNRGANVNVTPTTIATLPRGQNIYRVVSRIGDALIFADNTLLLVDKSVRIGEGGGSGAQLAVQQEIPVGLVNGSNQDFT